MPETRTAIVTRIMYGNTGTVTADETSMMILVQSELPVTFGRPPPTTTSDSRFVQNPAASNGKDEATIIMPAFESRESSLKAVVLLIVSSSPSRARKFVAAIASEPNDAEWMGGAPSD